VYGPVKEEGCWRIRKDKEIKDILQGEDIVKYSKSHRLIWHGHVEGMLNQRKPGPMETVTMEGTRETGRQRKRRRDGC
jgi:hypothetical protein